MANVQNYVSPAEVKMRREIRPFLIDLGDVQKGLKRLIITTMMNPSFKTRNILPFHNELSRKYSQMGRIFKKWAREGTYSMFLSSLRTIRQDLGYDRALAKNPTKTIKEIMGSRNTVVLTNLSARLMGKDFSQALTAGEKELKIWTRQTKYALASSPELEFSIFKGLAVKGNLDAAVTSIQASFQKAGAMEYYKTGATLVDSEGFIKVGKRRMKPNDYAELLARTKFHELQSQATLVQAKNYETDLLKISSHSSPDPLCAPYEGKVFSISGNTKGYPKLGPDDLPPYHPNCLHNTFLQFGEDEFDDVEAVNNPEVVAS